MNKTRHSIWIYAIALGLFVTSCGRKASVHKAAPIINMDEAYSILRDHNVAFDWWAGVGKANLDSEMESGSGKVYLRMKADSLIWMVGKKLSLEGIRAQITPSNITIKYPIEKVYQQGSTDLLLRNYEVGLKYQDMQQLLAGNIMLPDTSASQIDRVDSGARLHYSDGQYSYAYTIDSRQEVVTSLEVMDSGDNHIKVDFKDYRKAKGCNCSIAHHRTIAAPGQGQVDIRFSTIEIDVPKKTPFTISNRYTEIPL